MGKDYIINIYTKVTHFRALMCFCVFPYFKWCSKIYKCLKSIDYVFFTTRQSLKTVAEGTQRLNHLLPSLDRTLVSSSKKGASILLLQISFCHPGGLNCWAKNLHVLFWGCSSGLEVAQVFPLILVWPGEVLLSGGKIAELWKWVSCACSFSWCTL